jgi:nitroimidazol reductase NimA-like FMN-containing flavoprotein (pyridoxamine 5'-phosphate oxidase superfamily)
MTLGTADETGKPWVSPVYFASEDRREFYWVSSPQAKHSRNLAARPDISIVIFDSRAPIGTGQAVYMTAVAEQHRDDDLKRGIEIFSRKSVRDGASVWTLDDVTAPARLRLYRASVSRHFVLGERDERIPMTLE